jgi:galactokinase/mevalonate kinase-like predicted kinase
VIRASAPGRCGIVGNPTDGYGGTVIASALTERATVELRPASEILLQVCHDSHVVRGKEDLALDGTFTDVAKAVLTFFPEALEHRFHLVGQTTVPIEAGLAGSTAMLAAILGAVLRLLQVELPPYQVAETIRHIEFHIMQIVCGFQDQYMVAFGGVKYLDFRDKDPNDTTDPMFATVEDLEPYLSPLPLLLANTGVRRNSGAVHSGLRERWIAGDRAVVDGYVRCARLAREAKKALLSGDWDCVGTMMNENHAIQRDLGGSGEVNERLIQAALDAGALGAKLAGAGKGGTIIALHDDLDLLAERLQEAGAARILRVVPSDGLVVQGQL